MEYSVNTMGEATVVTLQSDRLDAASAVRFKDALKGVVDEGADYLVLDMSNVAFMDSSGLGALVAHMKYMGTERRFEIAGLTTAVDKVFKLTRMDKVFVVHDSIDALSDAQRAAG